MSERSERQPKREPIAIVGMSVLLPGSDDITGFWNDVVHGTSRITDIPHTHWKPEDHYNADPKAMDKTYAKRGGFVSPIDFDPIQWGIPPKQLMQTDTSQLLALVAAKRVLDDARVSKKTSADVKIDLDRTSCMLGVTSGQELMGLMVSRLQEPVWRKTLAEFGHSNSEIAEITARMLEHYAPWEEATFPGLLGNVVAGRIANKLGLGGSNFVTDAACASALGAIQMGVHELWLGKSDLVIAGGVDTMNDPFMHVCFSKTPALSPTGEIKPFSSEADGTLLGEGVAMVALKRLSDAERDGNRIYALISGIGSSSDGKGSSVYAPVPAGQAKAIWRAHEDAGVDPTDIGYVEGHGTGTKAGDAAELTGLEMVFGNGASKKTVAIGSIKSLLGHTKSAAGATGLIKAALQLNQKIIPRSVHTGSPNPAINWNESALKLPQKTETWCHAGFPKDAQRMAGVSSFGFGGSNFHAILEGYPSEERIYTAPVYPILISGKSREDVMVQVRALKFELVFQLKRHPDIGLSTLHGVVSLLPVSPESSNGEWRASLLVKDVKDAVEQLEKLHAHLLNTNALPGLTKVGTQVRVSDGTVDASKLAFLYPGQGSQYVGMLEEAAIHIPEVKERFVNLEEGLHRAWNKDAEQLIQTDVAQPMLYVAEAAMVDWLKALGVPMSGAWHLGHSFGEVSALYGAGVLDDETGFAVAKMRGALMKQAATDKEPSGLAAVMGEPEPLRAYVAGLDANVYTLANDNTDKQVVLGASKAALECLPKQTGITVKVLEVSHAFHTSYVASAAGQFETFLNTVNKNFAHAGQVISGWKSGCFDHDNFAVLLGQQLANPIRFRDRVKFLSEQGVGVFVEVGPKQVLSGLAKQNFGDGTIVTLGMDKLGVLGMMETATELYCMGLAPGFPSWLKGFRHAPVILERDLNSHWVQITGSNLKPKVSPMEIRKRVPAPEQMMTNGKASVMSIPKHATTPENMSTPEYRAAPDLSNITAAAMQYQKALTDAHIAYLQLCERLMTGPRQPVHAMTPFSMSGALPATNPIHVPSMPAPMARPPQASLKQQIQRPETPVPHATGSHMPPSTSHQLSQSEAPLALTPIALEEMLLKVVADKTGYPLSAINAQMNLESELGIDSIKRVEILSDFKAKATGLTLPPASELSSAKTLKHIVEMTQALNPTGPQSQVAHGQVSVSQHSAQDLTPLLLEVVSDKTGYPPHALKLSMSLENDLGIDSIKKVEIFSALKSKGFAMEPHLMNSIKTLGDVLNTQAPRSKDMAAANTTQMERPVVTRVPIWTVPNWKAMSKGSVFAEINKRPLLCLGTDATSMNEVQAEAKKFGINIQLFSDVPLMLSTLTSGTNVVLVGTDRMTATMAMELGTAIAKSDFKDVGLLWVGDARGEGFVKTFVAETGHAAVAIEILDGAWAQLFPALMVAGSHRMIRVGTTSIEARGYVETLGLTQASSPWKTVEHMLVVGGARGVTVDCLLALKPDDVDAPKPIKQLTLLGRTKNPIGQHVGLNENLMAEVCKTPELGRKILVRQFTKHALTEVETMYKDILSWAEVQTNMNLLRGIAEAVTYVSCDVKDASEVRHAISGLENATPVEVLVHAAGILADKRLADKTPEDFEKVYGTKVDGFDAVWDSLKQKPSRTVFFSSVASLSGNPGQADYALANGVLNMRAEQLRALGHHAVAIAYGPWDGGMVTPSLKKHFESMGVPVLSKEEGTLAFKKVLDPMFTSSVICLGPHPDAFLSMPVNHGQFWLSRQTYPELWHHVIKGKIVVPVAQVISWARLSGFQPTNLSVLKALSVKNFEQGEAFWFTQEDGKVCLMGKEGRHYQFTHETTLREDRQEAQWEIPKPTDLTLPKQRDVYDGETLFHGPHFQCIESFECGREVFVANLHHGLRLDDVQHLDAAFQAAVLWMKAWAKKSALPMSFDGVQMFDNPWTWSENIVSGQVREHDHETAIFDIQTERCFIKGLKVVAYANADATPASRQRSIDSATAE